MKKDVSNQNIEIRSEEFQEILGKIPGWILQKGILVVACFFLIILVGSAFFKYPDVITTEMTLTSITPPAALMAKTSGHLRELYVNDKDSVKRLKYLAVIENSARTSDVLLLKSYLQTFALFPDSIPALPPKGLQLGTMQSLYSSFYSTLFEYREFLLLQYYLKKNEFVKKRIEEFKQYTQTIVEQEYIVKEQEIIQYGQYQRDSILNMKKLISKEDLENSRNQYLQGCLSVKNLNSTVQNAKIQITQLAESLLDTENEYIEKKNELENGLSTITMQLLTEIQAWELMYALISPIDGEITFTNYWTTNQNVIAGEVVFNIIPTSKAQIIGKAKMPIARSGKVKIGQSVNIRFVNFPDNEFGIVRGIVKRVSAVPTSNNQDDKYYIVEIELPNGLCTIYDKELPYLPDMIAQADIVTEDLSLLERFFLPLKKIWKEGVELPVKSVKR